MLRIIIAVLLLTVALPAHVPAQTAASTTVKVGVLPAEVAAEAFYGIDMGFFRKHGIDVQLETFNNGAAIAAAIASGALDVGMSDLMSIISAHARGLPFIYIAPGLVNSEAAPTFGFVVKGDGPIHAAKDFNGKTIAVNGLNNISQIPTEAWIDRNGGDSKSIKWIELPFPAMLPAIGQGTVAAGLPPEPFMSQAVAQGERLVFMSKNAIAPVYLLSGWVTTKEWVARNHAAAGNFAAAIREIADWANRNQEASSPILAKYTKIPEAVIAKMHRGNFSVGVNFAYAQPVIDAAAKYGVIAQSFPARDLFDTGR